MELNKKFEKENIPRTLSYVFTNLNFWNVPFAHPPNPGFLPTATLCPNVQKCTKYKKTALFQPSLCISLKRIKLLDSHNMKFESIFDANVWVILSKHNIKILHQYSGEYILDQYWTLCIDLTNKIFFAYFIIIVLELLVSIIYT